MSRNEPLGEMNQAHLSAVRIWCQLLKEGCDGALEVFYSLRVGSVLLVLLDDP